MSYKRRRNTFLTFFFSCFAVYSLTAQDTSSALLQIARNRMNNGEYKSAISILDSFIQANQTSADAYNMRGCATIFQDAINDEKNNRLALMFFNKALQYDSTNYFCLSNRGWAWQNLKNLTKSYADYLKTVQLDSNNADMHGNVLRNLWIRNRYKEAYNYSNKMINKFPEDGYAYYVRGQLKRDWLHKYPEGNKDIRKSEELGWNGGFRLMY